MVEGLREAQTARETDIVLANPILPDDILQGRADQVFWSWACLAVKINIQ